MGIIDKTTISQKQPKSVLKNPTSNKSITVNKELLEMLLRLKELELNGALN